MLSNEFSYTITSTRTTENWSIVKFVKLPSAIQHFWHFVEGGPFHVLTDHKPLMSALSSHSLSCIEVDVLHTMSSAT